jgi:UTP--glucose-1-phosphate uridylyltransferase
MRVVEAVIPVAGLGSRLLPATRAVPKALLPLVDRPLVELVVEGLAGAGIERFVLVAGRDAEAIRRHFDADDAVEVVVQPQQLGLGDAVLQGASAVEGPFVVALGDALVGAQVVVRLIDGYVGAGAEGAVAVEPVPLSLVGRYGVAVPAGGGGGEGQVGPIALAGLVEKPAPATAPSRLAVAGRYVLSPAVIETLRATPPGRDGEVQLTDALDRHCRGSGVVVAVPLLPGERRIDVGDPEGYASAFVERALGDPRFGAQLRERIGGGDATG